LTVKNASAISPAGAFSRGPATQPAARRGPAGGLVPQPLPQPVMLASADPRAFVLAAASKTARKKPSAASTAKRHGGRAAATPACRPTTVATTRANARDQSPVVYRATFERDVRVFEADKQIIVGDHMNIDLLQVSEHEPTTAPSTRPAGVTTQPSAAKHERRAARASAGDQTGETASLASATQSATQPATPAATQPAQGPITVKWSGKLRVVPLESPPDPSLVPGKAVVQIVGSPVVLTREGTETHAGAAFYNSADQSASLRS